MDPFYVDFGSHFGGPKPIKNNIKHDEKLDHFWEPSGEAPGAFFCGFLAPQSEGLGGQKWVQNGVDNKTRDFQNLKRKPNGFFNILLFLGVAFSMKTNLKYELILGPVRDASKTVFFAVLC